MMSVDLPAPSTLPPHRLRKSARSATSGSRAAPRSTVRPRAQAAASKSVSVAPTLGNRRVISAPCRPEGASSTSRPGPASSSCTPIRARPVRCRSMGREPILHPPGSTVSARPCQQRRAEENGSPHLCRCLPRQGALDRAAGERHIAALPLGRAARAPQQRKAALHVREPWHAPQPDRPLAEQRGRQKRQDAVFCCRDADRSVQRPPTRYHDLFRALCHIRSPHSAKDTTGYAKGAQNVNPSDSTRVWCVICSSLFKIKPLRPRSGTSSRPPSVANATSPSGRRESILSGEPNRGIFTFPLLRRKAPPPSRPAAS